MYKGKNLGAKSQVYHMEISCLVINGDNSKVPERHFSTWFFDNVGNVKLMKGGRIHKIYHVTDTDNLLETENLEEYINNPSFVGIY